MLGNMRRRSFLWILSSLVGRAADAGRPKQIYLIRHGEKSGDKSDIHLNPRGRARAAALVQLFPNRFDKPDVLVASHQSAHSNREVETLEPLAQLLHVPIDDTFADEDYSQLAKHLLTAYPAKTILVCWHHGNLPALATALGVRNAPSPWADDRFDRLWRIRFDASGSAIMQDLPEHLLDHDS
jgi:phosphohistidine phosphatase SixA